MSSTRYSFSEEGSFTSIDNDSRSGGFEDDSDSEYHEIPYSSSSIDRSSVSSIPWADDVIKQNKLAWDKVERMFYGEEELSTDQELRNEILEWHKKFPQLLEGRFQRKSRFKRDDSSNIDNLSNGSFDSDENEDGFITPTATARDFQVFGGKRNVHHKNSNKPLEPLTKSTIVDHEKLISMLDRDLRISSVPVNVRYRNNNNGTLMRNQSNIRNNFHPIISTNSKRQAKNRNSYELSRNIPQIQFRSELIGGYPNSATRMPPIEKVPSTRSHLHGLTVNPSFLQLTPIQAQSAAISSRQQKRATTTTNRTTGHTNSIILPAINLRIHEIPASTNSSENSNSQFNTGNRLSGYKKSRHLEATSPQGRSVSAAQHRQLSAFYLPYSATKLKVFK